MAYVELSRFYQYALVDYTKKNTKNLLHQFNKSKKNIKYFRRKKKQLK